MRKCIYHPNSGNYSDSRRRLVRCRACSRYRGDVVIGQFEFGVKGTDFIGVLSTVLQRDTQSQFQVYLTDSASFPAHFPLPGAIPDGGCGTVRLCGARA